MKDNFEYNKQLGCFQIARSLFTDDLWLEKPSWWLKVWIYIIGKANHKDYSEKLKRGSFHTKNSLIFTDCNLASEGVKIDTIENVIKFLKKTQKVATQKTARGYIVTVLNYDRYQTISNFKNGTENGNETAQKRHVYKQEWNNEKKASLPFSKNPIVKQEIGERKDQLEDYRLQLEALGVPAVISEGKLYRDSSSLINNNPINNPEAYIKSLKELDESSLASQKTPEEEWIDKTAREMAIDSSIPLEEAYRRVRAIQ